MPARERLAAILVTVAAVALVWLPPIASGLWLDETGTAFVIAGSWRATVERALVHEGQSPLYYLVDWLAAHALGPHEWALRLPSLVFMLAALALLWRIAAALVDEAAAWWTVALFASSRLVAFTAVDARPYALALACALAATLALIRWHARGRAVDALVYALFVALAIYAHYLFAALVVVHAAFVVCRGRGALRPAAIALAAIVCALALAPLVPQLLSLASRRVLLAFASPPSLQRLADALVPVAPLAAAAAVAAIAAARKWQAPATPPGAIAFALAWLALPPLVVFAVSIAGAAQLFVPRYFALAWPAQALVFAWLARGFVVPRVRVAVLVAACAAQAFALAQPLTQHGTEDFRLALDAARPLAGPRAPLLLESGFIESAAVPRGLDDETRQFLLAPLAFYRVDAPAVALPYAIDTPGARDWLERLVATHLANVDRFVVVARSPTFTAWLDGRLRALGFRSRFVAGYGFGPQSAAAVTAFER